MNTRRRQVHREQAAVLWLLILIHPPISAGRLNEGIYPVIRAERLST